MFGSFFIANLVEIQVDALVGQRVLQVSCGSRDAQTLALVEGYSVNEMSKLL